MRTGGRQRFPLYVSQDGTPPHKATQELALSKAGFGVTYMHHHELQPPVPERPKENLAYYRISNHYKFIFHTFFDCLKYDKLIIVEVTALYRQGGLLVSNIRFSYVGRYSIQLCRKMCRKNDWGLYRVCRAYGGCPQGFIYCTT